MKKNLEDLSVQIDDYFSQSPSINQKAWGVINQFYHIVLTYMDENNITQADLARKLGKSRSAISQMFSKTPNISVKKMVEIADAVGIGIEINSAEVSVNNSTKYIAEKFTISDLKGNWVDINSEGQFYDNDFGILLKDKGINNIDDFTNAYVN
ncbi:MAG: helix-turn-helix transcriptional regulator [Ignavibacteriales bacterium]|nr:helix-turn-helix transcriptional regulator [Ignavibacteriales bacterium]MCF8438548.1 helix-turn-helix transcriptional regulator [Ignavibacteriales bacterium]